MKHTEVNIVLKKCLFHEFKKYFSLAIGTKVLVTTGYDSGSRSYIQNTELIDLADPAFKCTISQFPRSGSWAATGGLIGNTALICGGYDGNRQKSCYSLKEDGDWNLEASSYLNTARNSAANGDIVMNNKLVIAGGWTIGKRLDTIEVVAPNTQAVTLPIRLPVATSTSCIVPWDTNTFLIIGGWDGTYRKQTYFINIANNTIANGPDLLTARFSFGCHDMKINGEDFIIVAGGNGAWQSTEYLQKANYQSGWKKSKNYIVAKIH